MAVLLGLLFLYVMFLMVGRSSGYELRKRLRKLAVQRAEGLSSDLANEVLLEMTPFDKFLYRFSLIHKLDRLIESAGFKTEAKRFIVIVLAAGIGGFCVGLVFRKGLFLPVLLMIIGFFMPFVFLLVKKNKRSIKFTEQFPGTLEMIARSLKAGHSMPSAIQLVGLEMTDPVGTLFKTAYDVQTLGLSMKDSLSQMLESMPSIDLQLFVTAVNIHRDVGGNLSESLERLARMIRERLKVRRQVKVYTAQARLSAIILFILPLFMAAFFYFSTPGYIEELLTTDFGRYGIVFAVVAQCLGFLVMRKIINIKI
jgi:tight adherence protein B